MALGRSGSGGAREIRTHGMVARQFRCKTPKFPYSGAETWPKRTAKVGRQWCSHQSLLIVSVKREFFGIGPETFRHFAPETGRLGVWRPS